MIELAKFYYYIFGVLTIAGGVFGYIQAKSMASLVAGGISGVLLLVAGYLVTVKPVAAYVLALIVAIALAGRFLPVFLKTKGMMPAGLMAILSIIAIVITLVVWLRR